MKASYYPILKWKQGEQRALRGLDDDIKQEICPVIEVRNFAKNSRELYNSLDHAWRQRPFIIDYASPKGLLLDKRKSMLEEVLSRVERNDDTSIMFCLWLHMVESRNIDEIVHRLNNLKQPICIRVQGDVSAFIDLGKRLAEIYAKLDLLPERIILLADLKDKDVTQPDARNALAESLSATFIKKHHVVILANGAFPKTKSMKAKEVIKRSDITLWMELSDSDIPTDRSHIKYGDYTCHDPTWEDELGEEEKKGGPTIPMIRYAHADQWLVYKVIGSEDAFALSALLTRQSPLSNVCPCAACHSIRYRALPGPNAKPGNYRVHLEEGIIHHIHTVIKLNLEI